jgi:hypothetical protein
VFLLLLLKKREYSFEEDRERERLYFVRDILPFFACSPEPE